MPHVYKLSMEGLKRVIAEEKAKVMKEMGPMKKGFGPMGDPVKKAKKTMEVHADEYGEDKVHEKDIDQLKAQKVKESKLLMQLKRVRESKRALVKRIQEQRATKPAPKAQKPRK